MNTAPPPSAASDSIPLAKIVELYDLASQHDISNQDHSREACGITCLWMTLKYMDPSFKLTLEDLHNKEKKNEWHFRSSDGVWLQHGSAKYARELGLKAEAINLHTMGNTKLDIKAMQASGRISKNELAEYMELYEMLKDLPSYKEKLKLTLRDFVSRDIPVMVGASPGFGENKSNHRIICTGYDNDDAIIIDPMDKMPSFKRVSFEHLAKYSTGNLLAIYKGNK